MDAQGAGFLLRAWLWIVPIGMLIAAGAFAALAALDGRWGLVGAMGVIGLFAVILLALHWWIIYRFGRGTPP